MTDGLDPVAAAMAAAGDVAVLEVPGRSSGRPHRTAVGYVREPDGSLLVAASAEHTQWARNLETAGSCRVTVGAVSGEYDADPDTGWRAWPGRGGTHPPLRHTRRAPGRRTRLPPRTTHRRSDRVDSQRKVPERRLSVGVLATALTSIRHDPGPSHAVGRGAYGASACPSTIWA